MLSWAPVHALKFQLGFLAFICNSYSCCQCIRYTPASTGKSLIQTMTIRLWPGESMHLILTNISFLFCTGQGGKVAKGLSIANTPTTNVTTWATPGEWASSPCPTWGEYDSVELGYFVFFLQPLWVRIFLPVP